MNAKLCHRCNENYVGKLCPKCSTKAELIAGRALPAAVAETVAKIVPQLGKCIAHGEKKPRTLAAPALNKTEQRWQDAHPSHTPFPIRLRWGNCMHYTPDFLARDGAVLARPILIEVKGGHIHDRDIVRFKGAAAEWGWMYEFRMMQWKNRVWTRLY